MRSTKVFVPQMTVDNVIFGYEEAGLNILLVKHGEGKSKGNWGLPGDWLRADETLEQAAARVLFARTAIKGVPLNQLHTFSDVDRYPGKRIITTAYYTAITTASQQISPGENEIDAAWFPIKKVPKLIFDHKKILKTAIEKFRHQTRHEPIGLNLLPKKFTFFQLQQLYEAVLGQEFDKPNFRRKMRSQKFLINCGEQFKAAKHRTAALYRFDTRAYKALTKQGFSFNL